jgi:anaerobic selenocysteine-containing dehydrogenase
MSYDRLPHPLVREDGVLRQATWDEALERAAEGFRRNVAKHGPDCFAMRGTSMNVYAGERRLNLTSGAGNGSAGALPPG